MQLIKCIYYEIDIHFLIINICFFRYFGIFKAIFKIPENNIFLIIILFGGIMYCMYVLMTIHRVESQIGLLFLLYTLKNMITPYL